jgi:glyoxylase-like metal-dependent hydrolase (beta-lactamase superfamily II)
MKKLALLFTLAITNITHAWNIEGLGDYKFEKLGLNSYVMHGPIEEPNSTNLGFMNNPGMIIGSGGIIVIDPGGTYQTGIEVLKEIKKITIKPIVAVFNTHVHGDHWLGNQAILEKYPDIKIYAHPNMIAQAKNGEGERWIDIMNASTDGFSSDTIAIYPTDATSDRQVIKAGGETFEIHNDTSGMAHTNTDIMIEHIDSSTLFLGDNGFINRFGRFDNTSDIHGNIKTLEYAVNLGAAHYVPGHGPSGDFNDAIMPYLKYLHIIREETTKGFDKELADYEIKPIIEQRLVGYKDWLGYDTQLGKHIGKMLIEVETLDF